MKLFTVDAFTAEPFRGNQAAVCMLETEKPDDWLQALAREINYSETAFLKAREGDSPHSFDLRWFTPGGEVDLCGHATLASAHVLWNELGRSDDRLCFHTRSGILTAERSDDQISLDFPATPPASVAPSPELLKALGIASEQVVYAGKSAFDKLVILENAVGVIELNPDFDALATVDARGVIVSAVSSEPDKCDFVSRFFAPVCGINEDPVTGSAHCCLTPYWSEILGKHKMVGYQASERGGYLRVELVNDRIILGGTAVTVIRGELALG